MAIKMVITVGHSDSGGVDVSVHCQATDDGCCSCESTVVDNLREVISAHLNSADYQISSHFIYDEESKYVQ
jgi:hypothetical protein